MWLWWYCHGRDPRVRPVVVRYQPPAGLTPAEAGTLLDDRVDMRDIAATMVDLAVRGYLSIEERPQPSSKSDYVFHLRNGQWLALKPHEQQVLGGIFSSRPAGTAGADRTVPLSQLENVFYKRLPEIKKAVLDSLTKQALYAARPDKVRKRYFIVAVVVAVLVAYAGLIASEQLGMAEAPFIVAAYLTFAVMGVFAWFMPARTSLGTRALEEVLGFQEFLTQVEGPRLERMVKTPQLFEAFLPFAMAFRVQMQWAAAFDAIYVSPGSWYVGTPGQSFRAQDFASGLSEMSSSVGSTLKSSPRSSDDSGFSSGSSGGGSGGGGGGGF